MILSDADLALIRSQPQEYNLYLSLYQPETVFAAQLRNSVTDEGHRIIPYAGVTVGSATGVLPNFYMMVGSAPGGNDLGVVRVRDTNATGTANSFVVAENSHVQWSSGCYLTVLNYVDVEAIYPRIAQTAKQSGTMDATFYKDWDIIYTNQNTRMGSFVCMGPHRAAFRDPATGNAQLYWSSSGTTNVNGDAITFLWEFEGGTPSSSSARDPGLVTYSQPGHYRTSLRVSASGTMDIGYRFVSIYDQPDAGPNRPIVEWELSELAGSRKGGGYTGRVKIWERVGPEFVKDGQLVVLFSDDYYGQVRRNLGGNAENCSDIFWVGYVLKDTIVYDFKQGTVQFDIGSVTEMMKQSQGFSVSCQDDRNPDTWYKIKNLSVQRALYHYMRWHTTAFNVADFQYTGDDRDVQYFDSNRESMYDAIAAFINTGIKGDTVSDRQGKIWVEIAPEGTPNSNIAYPVCMSIGENDWASNPPTNASTEASKAQFAGSGPEIVERIFPEVSYVDYGGIIYQALPSGTSIAVLAGGPGLTPAYKGTIDSMEGLILTSQNQLNQIVGASYAYQNSRFPEVSIQMVGAFKNIDIAPLETFLLTIPEESTPRRIP